MFCSFSYVCNFDVISSSSCQLQGRDPRGALMTKQSKILQSDLGQQSQYPMAIKIANNQLQN